MVHGSPPCHWDMSLPSNNTIASDGGPPGGPGSTTFGSDQAIPLDQGGSSSSAFNSTTPAPNVAARTAQGPSNPRLERITVVTSQKTGPRSQCLNHSAAAKNMHHYNRETVRLR